MTHSYQVAPRQKDRPIDFRRLYTCADGFAGSILIKLNEVGEHASQPQRRLTLTTIANTYGESSRHSKEDLSGAAQAEVRQAEQGCLRQPGYLVHRSSLPI